jgi:hypothetical protein
MGDKSRAMREFGGGRGGFGFGGKKEGFDEEESSSFSSSSESSLSESSGEEDVEEEEEEEKEGNFKENTKPSTGKRGKFAFFSSGLEEMTRRKGGGGREDDDDDDDIEDDDDDIEDDIDGDEILEVREYNTQREHQQQWQNQKPPPPLLPNANTSTNNFNNNKNKEWRKLLPHYVPASELFLGSRVNNEVVFVDYQAQFNSNGKRKTQVPMTVGEREAYDAQMQNPFNTSKNNNNGANQQEARWYTTGAGVRTYVTKTGQKLTGKRAYDASIKDQQKWGL